MESFVQFSAGMLIAAVAAWLWIILIALIGSLFSSEDDAP